MPRALIDLLVLDAIADDVEAFDHILERVNRPSQERRADRVAPFSRSDLVPALTRLVRDGLAQACTYSETEPALVPAALNVMPQGPLEELSFMITGRGLMVLQSGRPASGPMPEGLSHGA